MSTLSGPSPQLLRDAHLNPGWSRFVTFEPQPGQQVTWHVLDTGMTEATTSTLVCVHGNPTWSYLFRDLLTTAPAHLRVIAVDQSGMGFSERTHPRRLADRIGELVAFCRQEVSTPLSFAAHDWGGAIAVGATAHLHIEALVLANTAVGLPDNVDVPPLISTARRFVDLICRRTRGFVAGTAMMTTKEHREALNAPYRSADRRSAVADFVADIPLEDDHPSREALNGVGKAFDELRIPILLLWGAKDQVFHDRFLSDLRKRQPTATVERFEQSSHLVLLDGNVGPTVHEWLISQTSQVERTAPEVRSEVDREFVTAFTAVERNANSTELLYQGPDGELSWSDLNQRAGIAASVLVRQGIGTADRVALLIPPSPHLLIAVVALWRVGAIPVVVDPSSGLRALRRQLRAQAPRAVLGTRASLLVATLLRCTPGAKRMGFGASLGATNLATPLGAIPDSAIVSAEDLAAIVHTSGATGPAKAVAYTHGALVAQRDPMAEVLGGTGEGAFTTSFGAFSLLAPALERPFIRPDVPVDQPSKLGFEELRAVTGRAEINVAWLSPASARRLVETAKGRHLPLPRVLLAGAPISPDLVTRVAEVTKGIVLSPYGMTECLPITTGEGAGTLHPSGGVVVGPPVNGATIRLRDLNTGHSDVAHGDLGEILVTAPWMYAFYDQRHRANIASTVMLDGIRFHATGDVGLMHDDRLVVLGRLRDVVYTETAVVAPLTVETPLSHALGREVAMVGVGPKGAQVIVAVLASKQPRLTLATPKLSELARAHSPATLSAVLMGQLPVDHRHQSKVDHAALAARAEAFLLRS